jgi:hypothetical protein
MGGIRLLVLTDAGATILLICYIRVEEPDGGEVIVDVVLTILLISYIRGSRT